MAVARPRTDPSRRGRPSQARLQLKAARSSRELGLAAGPQQAVITAGTMPEVRTALGGEPCGRVTLERHTRHGGTLQRWAAAGRSRKLE